MRRDCAQYSPYSATSCKYCDLVSMFVMYSCGVSCPRLMLKAVVSVNATLRSWERPWSVWSCRDVKGSVDLHLLHLWRSTGQYLVQAATGGHCVDMYLLREAK
ncbi:hypothetical protein IF2G_02335 [Cordyceps javanica]|nr:hypothetical protein IF2G_02335 [Cordyceps javanica]